MTFGGHFEKRPLSDLQLIGESDPSVHLTSTKCIELQLNTFEICLMIDYINFDIRRNSQIILMSLIIKFIDLDLENRSLTFKNSHFSQDTK